MTTRLGIFGDSFAANKGEFSWTHQFDESKNYAKGGTGFDWTYLQFKQYHTQHDRNIVFVSNLMRETIFSFDDEIRAEHLFGLYDNDRETSNGFFRQDYNTEVESYVKGKKKLWTKYPYTNVVAHTAMIDAIIALRPETVIVHSYPQMNPGGMYNISLLDIVRFDTTSEKPQRCNHMSPEQNKVFADLLRRKLNDNMFDLSATMTVDSVTEYYNPSSTIEESGLKQ